MADDLQVTDSEILENEAEAATGAKTTRGAVLLLGAKLFGRGLDFISLIVLTHLLRPTDFGIVSLAMSLIYLTEAVFELPLYQALVVLERVDRAHTDTAFTITLLRGLALCLVILVISIPFAAFYHDRRLFPLLIALSFAPALRGMQSPGIAQFARKLDFSRECILELSGKVGALLVSIIVAATTRSYWAVAAATISNSFFLMAASYIVSAYKPRLTLSKWHDFKSFLGWSSGAQIISAINWQYDRLILGRLVPPHTLGAFSIASDLVAIPSQAIILPLSRPLLSAFVSVRDNMNALRNLYRSSNSIIFMAIIPVFIELSSLSDEIVHTILGQKWEQSIKYISYLAIPPIIAGLTEGISALVMTFHKNYLYMRLNLIEFGLKIPIITGSVFLFGVVGACWARIGVATLMMLVCLFTTRSLLQTSYVEVFFQNWRTFLAGMITWASIKLLDIHIIPHSWIGIIRLIVLASMGIIIYVSSIILFWRLNGQKPNSVEAQILNLASKKLNRFKTR